MKRPVFKQSRTLQIFLSSIFLFCPTKIFRLSDSCPATTKKISQRLQADGNNPALSPTLQLRKSHRGRGLDVKPPSISQHCGDNQKVITRHISPANPPLSCRWGGGAVDTNDWCITFTRLIGIVEKPRASPSVFNTSLGTLCNVNSKLNGKSCLIPLVIFGTPLQTLIVPICMQRRVASVPAHQSYNNLAD